MFGRRAEKESEDLRCSFCNKDRDHVRKLIAGPRVFICDECVGICTDILADHERAHEPRPMEQPSANWSAPAWCSLCRMALELDDTVFVEERGLLCRPCISAIEAAVAAAADDVAPDEHGERGGPTIG